MNLEQSVANILELHQKLHKTEKRFNRVKWIFKPVIVLAFISVAVTSFLPFLLPFTTPVILAGVAAVILRLVIYKYVFGDPETKFKKAVKEEYTPTMFNHFASEVSFLEDLFIDVEAINRSYLFMLRADSLKKATAAEGSIANLSARFSFVTIANDDITLKSIIKGIADDTEDFLTGLSTDLGQESDLENKQFFKGFLTQISIEAQKQEIIIVSSNLAEAYVKKSRYTKGWSNTNIDSSTFSVLSKSQETQISESIVHALNAFEKAGARKVFISIINDKMTIAFPWAKNWLSPRFEDKAPIDQNFAGLFNAQKELVHSLAKSSI
jgi:hypothetical protein